ncbi:failed axon connections homolog [Panulirus ornatus]|uniref:failed axon connections homolog n=1 Tax=Panulirus ornatus TaxID=150431 RepID=UPI003A8488D5
MCGAGGSLRSSRGKCMDVDQDVVLLHQFQRGKYCPNLSPYALKVEAFLRLADIKYEVDTKKPFGPKGKCPWITINGEDVADSQFILEHLTERFNVKIDNRLGQQKAASLEAVRILADEHLFWCVVTWRYWLDGCVTFLKSQSFPPKLHRAFPLFMKRGMKRRAKHHGIGLHSPEQIYHICRKDCATLASILGEDDFFGGDEPCTSDCSVFGQLAQLMWNAPGSHYQALLTETYPNLDRYCHRMKDRVFPDWDQLLDPPQ